MRLTRRFEEDGVKAVWCRSINDTFLEGESGYEEAEKLAAYEDAEEQGLLAILPCKIGNVLYYISRGGIKELIVREIRIREYCTDVLTEDIKGEKYAFSSGVIGKTVFLTKAEAEKALERMNNNG